MGERLNRGDRRSGFVALEPVAEGANALGGIAHQPGKLAATTKQPWGSFDVQARASQFLHDGSKQNLSVSGFVDVRLTRGLSLNVFAFASRVRDQLFIAAGTLSRDDILTQQRALATSYSYNASIGLSYTFGSIFNSVVNPRLDSLGGGQGFVFFF